MNNENNYYSITELKVGDTIMLLESRETFHINKIFPDGRVDMTSTKQYDPEMGFDWYEKLFSVRLVNFEIVKDK